MSDPIIRLSELAHKWLLCSLPKPVVWSARRALLDWFATTIPGTIVSPSINLKNYLESGQGQAFSYVDREPKSVGYTSFINAVASHTVEFDDIFKDGGYHPGSPTISAALAVAQHNNFTLESFQRAIIGAYDVGCRLSLAIQPAHYKYWHTTSTVGTIGAAVACVLLHQGSLQQVINAIGIASSFAGGHQANLQGNGQAKSLHAGHAAQAGILAANAALAGVESSLNSLSSDFGWANATTSGLVNWDKAFAEDENWAAISNITVKNHGCCGHIFPAIDAIEYMLKAHGISVEKIVSIEVHGYEATKMMCDRESPNDAQQARFSAQYCIAAFCILGKVRLNAFTEENLNRKDIAELSKRIKIFKDTEISNLYPKVRSARVMVRMFDGKVYTHTQKIRRGDPEDPLTDAELIEKFRELTRGVLSISKQNSLESTILYENRLPFNIF